MEGLIVGIIEGDTDGITVDESDGLVDSATNGVGSEGATVGVVHGVACDVAKDDTGGAT